MIKRKVLVLCFLCFSINTITAKIENRISKNGIVVEFINEDQSVNDSIVKLYLDTFFQVYPKLSKEYNKEAIKQIKIKIDSEYTGVAYAHNGQITISAKWMKNNPYDADLITHEAMHIVQQYPGGSSPGWLVEGVADYARFKFGLNNDLAKWSLPKWKEGSHYTNSYRVTAKFLVWVSKTYNKKIVKLLDKEMRLNNYSAALWKNYTNKSLDELWDEYAKISGHTELKY